MTLGLVTVFAVALVVAAASTPLVRRVAHRLGALDHPSPQKTHVVSLPRVGGLAVGLGWVAALGAAWLGSEPLGPLVREAPLAPIVGGGLLVFATGLWDDVRGLGPGPKLVAEFVAAGVIASAGVLIERVTFFGVTLSLGSAAFAATVLWIVTLTNAFNLVDGLDGLATGLAIIAGVTCGAILVMRGDYATAAVLCALVGGLCGFLPFNFNPATIFLGDSGSLLTGFVLAVTAITGWQKGATVLAVGVPLLVFALPILDLVGAVVRRVWGGHHPTGVRASLRAIGQPDRLHIHHRLLTVGLSHRSAVLTLYVVALCLSGAALLTMERP